MFDEILKNAKKAMSITDIIAHPFQSAKKAADRFIPDDSPVGVAKNTVFGLPQAAKDVGVTVAKGLRDQVVKPSPEQLDFENKNFNYGIKDVPNWEKPLYKAATVPAKLVTRLINPGLQPLGQNLSDIRYVHEIADQVRTGKLPLSTLDELAVLHKSNAQIVGDVAQAVMTADLAKVFIPSAVLEKPAAMTLTEILKNGAVKGLGAGTAFGTAQALSSGTDSPLEFASIIGSNQIAGGILGAITDGSIPVGEKAFDAVKLAKERYDAMPARLKQGGYIANPFSEGPKKVNINNKEVEISPKDVVDYATGNRTDEVTQKIAQEKGIEPTDFASTGELRDHLNDIVKNEMAFGRIVEDKNSYKVGPELQKQAEGSFTTHDLLKEPATRTTALQREIDQNIQPNAPEITKSEDVLLRDKMRTASRTAKEVAGNLNKEFKTTAKDIAAEQYGRGEKTGFFEGEKEGKASGEKLGTFKTEKEYQAKIIDIKKQFKDKAASQSMMRESIRQFAEDHLPVSERGKYLNAAANTKTPSQLNKAFNRLVEASGKYRAIIENKLAVGTRMQKIGYIRKIGEFSNTLIRDIKSKLGIEGSLRDLTPEQLDVVIDEAKQRLAFKQDNNGIEANKQSVQPSGREIPQDELAKYREELKNYNSTKNTVSRKISQVGKAISKFGADAMTPFSSRLKGISPVLKKVFRNEFDAPLKKQIHDDSKVAAPLFKYKKKMSPSDFADLDYMLKNGDTKSADAIAQKYGFTKELADTRKMMEGIHKRASEVGEVGYIKDYFPRIVKDKEGLLKFIQTSEDHVPINEAIKSREIELGRELDPTERLQVINTMLRGFDPRNISLSDVGNMKNRQMQELTPEMAKFYDDSFSSVQRYVESMNELIQARKLFGKSIKKQGYEMPAEGEQSFKIEDTIAAYVDGLIKDGTLNPEKAAELSELLKVRFNPARISGLTSFTKDLISVQALNNISFGINNLQDLTTAIYRFGWAQTAKSGLKVIASGIPGLNKVTPKIKLTARDIGLDRMNEDIQSTSRFKKVVNGILKITSLHTDHFTRTTYIDAMLSKYEKQAMQSAHPELMKRLQDSLLEKDIAPALEALQNHKVNEAVEKLAYNEIADYQPVSISEMPVDYISADKARLLYSLKSYIVKQLDYMRQEHWAGIKANPRSPKPYYQLAKYAFALMATGATTEVINDLMFNRDIKGNEIMVNNFLRMFGVSRYTFYQAQSSGLKSAIANTIFPGFGPLEDAFKDATQLPDSPLKSESIKAIPFLGRNLYWWYGKGADKTAKAAKSGSSKDGELGLSSDDLGLSAKDLGLSAKDLGI